MVDKFEDGEMGIDRLIDLRLEMKRWVTGRRDWWTEIDGWIWGWIDGLNHGKVALRMERLVDGLT